MTLITTPEIDAKLKEVAADAGHNDPYQVVKNALALYTFVIENKLLGREFVLRDLDGTLHEVVVK